MYRITENMLRCAMPIVVHFTVLIACGGILPGASNAALAATLAAVIILPIWFYIWKKDRERSQALAAKGGNAVVQTAAAFIAGAAASRAASWAMTALGMYKNFSNQAQEELLAAPFLLQLIGLGVLVPIAEEWLYRGILFERIREWAPLWAAVLLNAGLFALGHGNVIQIAYALPMGIILSIVYIATGKLCVPMAFHIGANMITVLLNH